MRDILKAWDMYPSTYSGELAPLNALLDIGVQNNAAFERLIRLSAEKRKLLPGPRRVDYQRDYMAERRARLAKALELRQLVRGPFRDRAAKAAAAKDIQATWRKARDAFIASRGELSWAARNEAANEFWEDIDAKLEANLVEERAKARARRGG